jgi:hypothetical protein
MTACCEQECRIASIVSLSDACTTLRRKQVLNHLQTSFLGCEKKGSLVFIIFFCDSRTMLQQAFHRAQMPANASQMKCTCVFNVNECDIRLTFDIVAEWLFALASMRALTPPAYASSMSSMFAPPSTTCLTFFKSPDSAQRRSSVLISVACCREYESNDGKEKAV